MESNLELFIEGGDCYYELEVNAANTIYKVFHICKDAFTPGSRFDTLPFDVLQAQVYTFGGDNDRTGNTSGKALTREGYGGIYRFRYAWVTNGRES